MQSQTHCPVPSTFAPESTEEKAAAKAKRRLRKQRAERLLHQLDAPFPIIDSSTGGLTDVVGPTAITQGRRLSEFVWGHKLTYGQHLQIYIERESYLRLPFPDRMLITAV